MHQTELNNKTKSLETELKKVLLQTETQKAELTNYEKEKEKQELLLKKYKDEGKKLFDSNNLKCKTIKELEKTITELENELDKVEEELE